MMDEWGAVIVHREIGNPPKKKAPSGARFSLPERSVFLRRIACGFPFRQAAAHPVQVGVTMADCEFG